MSNHSQNISGQFLGNLSRGLSPTMHYLDSGVGLSFDESQPPSAQRFVRSQNQQSPPAGQERPVPQVNNEDTENSESDDEQTFHTPSETLLADHDHAQPIADQTTPQDQVPLALPEPNTAHTDSHTDSALNSSTFQDRKRKKVRFASPEISAAYQEPNTKSSPNQARDVKKVRFAVPEPDTVKVRSSSDSAPLHDNNGKKKVRFLLPPPELTHKEPSDIFKAREERKRARKEEFARLRSISTHDEYGVTTADRENGEDEGTGTTRSRPVLITRRSDSARTAMHSDSDNMDTIIFAPSPSRPLVPIEQIVNAHYEQRYIETNGSRADGSQGTSTSSPEVRSVHRSVFRGSPAVGVRSQELIGHLLAHINSARFRQRSRPFMAPRRPMLYFPLGDNNPALRQPGAYVEEQIRSAQAQQTDQTREDLDVLAAYAREATKIPVFFSPKYDNLPAEEPPERDLWASPLM
ncbi:hypothetical protein KJ359_007784 [Pestalotiopsis sp. 9143b]|nr:hypothetical protein KJ359_007784 [Pestalotiopsis sp. 9143b]